MVSSPLTTPEEWKSELASLADPQRTVYPQSGPLSATDWESPPAKDDVLATDPCAEKPML